MTEYPKMLYGPKGWEDLADAVTVQDAEEEAQARESGYRMLNEQQPEQRSRKQKAE